MLLSFQEIISIKYPILHQHMLHSKWISLGHSEEFLSIYDEFLRAINVSCWTCDRFCRRICNVNVLTCQMRSKIEKLLFHLFQINFSSISPYSTSQKWRQRIQPIKHFLFVESLEKVASILCDNTAKILNSFKNFRLS